MSFCVILNLDPPLLTTTASIGQYIYKCIHFFNFIRAVYYEVNFRSRFETAVEIGE